MSKYDIIYADPPWDYKGQKQHNGKGGRDTGGAIVHYPTLTLAQLKTLDVPSVCKDNCLLFMWSSSPHLDQAIELMKAWGFKWATVGFVWDKQKVNPGFYTMSQCELCLIGKRGKIPTNRGARNVRQFISEERGKHSAKPMEVQQRITEMFPNHTKLEMFSRSKVDGWDSFGNEVDSDIIIPFN
jgi:N6-adenosine-specific RNA methylase IME4